MCFYRFGGRRVTDFMADFTLGYYVTGWSIRKYLETRNQNSKYKPKFTSRKPSGNE